MQAPELPPKPEETTSNLLAKIVAVNFVVLLLLGAVWGIGVMLALPVLNMVVGLGLLFTRHRKLGKVLLLTGLVVGLLGLGTCALILSNLHVNH
ncbi:hypothetical protein [Hymenobacter metallilatus]|uniref:Uncharacterized protein n=1 Tax=Hymenobacter metallilatus TaxID=2493666 RepID=A0A428IYG3_9BACT|nr:hypothetical protein [Hymenobacter metallilatus]RSK23984.1 hypothetical protein EI290_21130 [Hymenobacter metallilatus]